VALISGGNLVLGDTTPMFAQASVFNAGGVSLTQKFASYAAIYRGQIWVYTVVNKLAKGTARLPLKVYERGDGGSRVEQRDSAYARLLRSPNPKHDAHFLWMWTASTRKAYGEALWLKVRGRDGQPAEVWPLHPTNVIVRKEQDGNLTYLFTAGMISNAAAFEIPAADIVHFRGYNPDTTLRGMSPLEPLRQTLLNEDAARRANDAFWRNGARPAAYLTHPGKLSDPAISRLKQQWDDIHGGVDNFAKTAILEEGMEPHILSLSAEEAQYIESRKLNREEVCGAYDVPPPVVHILDHATFSNITEQMRSMYRDTMAPDLAEYESVLDHQLRPDFDRSASLYAEFLMDEVMRGSLEERAASIQSAVSSAQLTPNEARALSNLPAMAGGDRLYVNSAVIPIDEVSRRTSPVPAAVTPAEPAQEQADAPVAAEEAPGAKSLTRDTVRTLMGRLGRCVDLREIDPAKFTAGCNGSTSAVLTALAAAATVDDLKARIRAMEV
jgi:HK97 family phage portal protein